MTDSPRPVRSPPLHRFLTAALRRLAVGLAGLTAAATLAASNADVLPGTAAPFAFPTYTAAVQIDEACRAMLDDLKRGEAELAAMSPRAGAGSSGNAPADAEVLSTLDALHRRAEDTMGPLAVLVAVHPDKSLRDAAEACDRATDAFDSAFRQNAAVYVALKAVVPADDVDRAFIRHQLDRFDDAGVALPPAGRDRARELDAEISRLGQDFARRLREDRTRVPFAVDELRGVPEAVWKEAPRDADGRVLLGLDQPTVQPVLERAESAAARERLWRAFNNRGGDANLRTLAQLVERRRDYARLFGHASWADHVLRHRMAQSTAEVRSFLASVQAAVTGFERADLAVLREAKAAHLGTPPEATALDRWDVAFYGERVRRARFQVDQERFRAHFPPEASLDFVFRLAGRLFGIAFAPAAQPPWHADARAFEVRDTADGGRPLGTLFVDLYPRADKYNHAAVWSFRSVSTAAGRLPAAALVVNFNRRGLTLGELETLLHEFGHALHSLLSETRYASHGGTQVKRDFVEAPSQMLEEWVYDPAVLALFQEVCAACKPVPRELLADAERARRFGRGITVGRQALFAGYDLALYGREAFDPMALWQAMEGATPLGHVPGSRFPAGFGHIAGGYAAGYYGYLWSLVLAEDLRTAFIQPDGSGDWLNADTGRRLRRAVLARGGEVEPAEMVRRFLGRPSDSRAFFRSLDKR